MDGAGRVIHATVVLTVLALMYRRLDYGLDFMDEALSVAFPYRFALGDMPFRDEYNFTQLSGLLTFPLVCLYLAFVPDAAGIVVWMRHGYYVFSLLVGLSALAMLRSMMPTRGAVLLALVCVVSMPFNMPALGYNTLGSGLFSAASFLGTWALVTERPVAQLRAVGFLAALGLVAHPALAPAFLLFGVLAAAAKPHGSVAVLRAFAIGASPPLILVGVVCLMAGLPAFLGSLTYTWQTGIGGGAMKVLAVVKTVPHLLIRSPILAAWTATTIVAARFGSRWTPLLLVTLPLAAIWAYGFENPLHRSLGVIAYQGLLAPLFLYLSPSPDRKRLSLSFGLLWLPSLLAAASLAYTSSNGYVAAGLGMLPACLCSWLMAFGALRPLVPNPRLRQALWSASLLATLGAHLTFQQASFYGEEAGGERGATVRSGPFEGIRTSEFRARFIEELRNDLLESAGADKRVLFVDNFPAGYLLSSMRPAVFSVWQNKGWINFPLRSPVTERVSIPEGQRPSAMRYFNRRDRRPDVIVKMAGVSYPRDDPATTVLGKEYEAQVERKHYVIYRRTEARRTATRHK